MPRLLPIAAALLFTCASALADENNAQPNAPSLPQPEGAQSAPAAPQSDANPATASPRYSFREVKDGFLRLDTQSGAVSFCGPRAIGWACQAAPEERAALDQEITRLRGEVASLKKDLAAAKPPAKDDEVRLKLPTREEIEQARAFVEDAWRRLVDMVSTMQKDMMRKE
jgi:hypothetical protein